MYTPCVLWIGCILSLSSILASSESMSEVVIRCLSSTLLYWCKRTEDLGKIKLQYERDVGAYSLKLQSVFRVFDELEPIPPEANILKILKMSLIDTTKWISDDDLVKNISHHKNGELSDDDCSECGLSFILHKFPKKHHCDIVKMKKDVQDEDWAKIKLSLVTRMNSLVLKSNFVERKVQQDEITEKIVNNLNKLADKIDSMTSSPSTTNSASKAQVVARRNCPAWTAGTPIEVFGRWVRDWTKNDKSDELIKYMDIVKSLSDNKAVPGLKEYMKNIVMPSLSATKKENVESVLSKFEEKYNHPKGH